MSTDYKANPHPDGAGDEIHLQRKEDRVCIARDLKTDLVAQGETREEPLAMLDEVIGLHHGTTGESVESWNEERNVLEELDIDADEVKAARESDDIELPDFMR